MERFIRRENIKHYRKLLRDVKDEAERRLIKKLLNEAEEEEAKELRTLASRGGKAD